MRLIFPTSDNQGYLSKRGAHFGKAKYYTIITLDKEEIVDVESLENPGHETGACSNAIQNILSFKPDALIVEGIGTKPAQGFKEAGLEVYFDQDSKVVKQSIDLFLENKLEKSTGKGTCSVH